MCTRRKTAADECKTCVCNFLCVADREYRDARKIPLNVEHRMMLGMAPDYDHLMVIQKVEVFEHALDSTSGQHAHNV